MVCLHGVELRWQASFWVESSSLLRQGEGLGNRTQRTLGQRRILERKEGGVREGEIREGVM